MVHVRLYNSFHDMRLAAANSTAGCARMGAECLVLVVKPI